MFGGPENTSLPPVLTGTGVKEQIYTTETPLTIAVNRVFPDFHQHKQDQNNQICPSRDFWRAEFAMPPINLTLTKDQAKISLLYYYKSHSASCPRSIRFKRNA